MATRIDITALHNIALHYGGKCLSKEYKDEHSPLEWMCEKGHRWESPYKVINQGGWCVQCLKKERKKGEHLERLKEIAIEKGGKCLATEFVNRETKMKFQCALGHIWYPKPNNILNGSWCKKCGIVRRSQNRTDNIETFHKLAAAHEGKCLSRNYINGRVKLEFECHLGHKWKTMGEHIKAGHWCPKCGKIKMANARKNSMAIYQEFAIKNGGKCLSTDCENQTTKLEMECAKGHRWKMIGSSLLQGHWCAKCAYEVNGMKQRDSLETYQKIAEMQGGKCLSTEYINCNINLEFQCREGHNWRTSGSHIKNGSWCSVCRNKENGLKKRDTIEMFYNIAQSHGGKCLSSTYNGSASKLEFECDNGHKWIQSAKQIKTGRWCRKCKTIEKRNYRESNKTHD